MSVEIKTENDVEALLWGGPLPPDTKYQMMWMGQWRRVVNMFDVGNIPTTLAMRAAKVVLYIEPDYWVATTVSPGEVVERFDRDPNKRYWEYL